MLSLLVVQVVFFFNATATTEIYTILFVGSVRCVQETDTDVVCLGDTHIIYMCLSIMGLALYYPISTFLYPNLQFQDKGLDLKYNPSYLVLLIQLKLIISGSDSFFKSFDGSKLPVIIQLIIQLCSMLSLSFLCLKYKPCLISIINLLDACLYLIIATICIASIIVVFNSDLSLYCLIGFILLSIILVVITIIIWKKNNKRHQIVPIVTQPKFIFDSGIGVSQEISQP
eukprot:TRINITY_DN7692_c0_g1_i1.p1 TRINITY_DN7692_c0_g1~~TRINITY_DN7692_c0_g1_i1.p1  ORF type:complete len:228 (-),score=16.55 TRINITY_DN7692_c0_g1_i1:75-758(-)